MVILFFNCMHAVHGKTLGLILAFSACAVSAGAGLYAPELTVP